MNRSDVGMSLVEVLVALTLFLLAFAMFGGTLVASTRAADASQDMGAITDQARLALAQLDRQVRFGYMIQNATITGAASAVKVLTPNSLGDLECWFWAVDAANGRLMSYHYSYADPQGKSPAPPLNQLGSKQWHVEAGPEDPLNDPRRVTVTGTLTGVYPLAPLYPGAFKRASYFGSVKAALLVSKLALGGNVVHSVGLDLFMSLRNEWIGAQYETACP